MVAGHIRENHEPFDVTPCVRVTQRARCAGIVEKRPTVTQASSMRREGTMQRRVGASRAILLAAVVAGCGTSVAPPIPSASAPTAAPSGPVALKAGFPDAGIYTTTAFRPRLTFPINDDGWQVLFDDDEDELALEDDSGDGTMFLAGRIAQVVGPDGAVIDAPDDLVEWLGGDPSLTAAAPAATTVDSQPATSIDVTNEDRQQADLFAFPTGNFHIPPGVRLRFTVVPMDGPDLVITTGGSVDQFDAAMARTKPMLDSLQIGD